MKKLPSPQNIDKDRTVSGQKSDGENSMLIMNIGLPGSGKSLIAKKLGLSPPDFYIVNPDQIRYECFGVTFETTIEPEVWTIACALVKGHFRLGRSVVLDATNLTQERRRTWIQLARKRGHHVAGLFFNLPLETVKRQNRLRPKEWVVPDEVVEKMYHSFQKPEKEEGFHTIITVENPINIDIEQIREEFFGTLQPFTNLPQS